jgi:hypothetical protein
MLEAWYHKRKAVSMVWRAVIHFRGRILCLILAIPLCGTDIAAAQSVSGVRGLGGGVAPLFSLVGPGNLYVDTQGTQGYIYNFGNNFESYNFRNPVTGQAWSGAMMTLGPQLSIGLIQGANQVGSPLVFPPVPRDVAPVPPIQSTILDDIP